MTELLPHGALAFITATVTAPLRCSSRLQCDESMFLVLTTRIQPTRCS